MRKILFFIILFALVGCGSASKKITFDEKQAFAFLEEQCDFGPRNPGSEAIALEREYIKNILEQCNALVKTQSFTVYQDSIEYYGENISASFHPELTDRILLGAHYDTRPWADKDPNPDNHNKPILGANDGASGVAVLLELANILADNKPKKYGVDLVFFDLEDIGKYQNSDSWCKGSEYYAANMLTESPDYVIVVDMIGDEDLSIPMEYNSYQSAPELILKLNDYAEKHGFSQFKRKIGLSLTDDHVPFIKRGYRAIDLIDFDYPFWHTLEDTPDKCSEKSLLAVGQTLVDFIYLEK